MKKTLVALAALAATGAFAQSTVSIWGAVDASYNYASADLAAGNQTKSFMGNSQLGSSKLGFSGLEDLGGGLKAKFWLEAGHRALHCRPPLALKALCSNAVRTSVWLATSAN